MQEYIVTVMAQDRVGIVSDVSKALTSLGGNITHLSQTVMRGYFTLIISAQLPDELDYRSIRRALEAAGCPAEFEIGLQHYVAPSDGNKPEDTERFVLTARGVDKPGIIYRLASYLAENNINIDDFYAYVHEGDLLMILQVAIPIDLNIHQLKTDLNKVGEEFGLAVSLQHENIILATSEIRPVKSLRMGGV